MSNSLPPSLARLATQIARVVKARGISVWLEAKEKSGFKAAYASGFAKPSGMSVEEWQNLVRQAVSRAVLRKNIVKVRIPSLLPSGNVASEPSAESAPVAWFVPFGENGVIRGVAGILGGEATDHALQIHAPFVCDCLNLLEKRKEHLAGRKNAWQENPIENLAVGLLKAKSEAVAARIASDWLGSICRAEKSCLFERYRNGWRLLAAQGAKKIDRGAPSVLELEESFRKFASGKPMENCFGGPLDKYCSEQGSSRLGILLDHPREKPDDILRSAAPLIIHSLLAKGSLWKKTTQWFDSGKEDGLRSAWRIALLIAILPVFALIFYPVPHTLSGKCELVPSQRASATFETSGKVSEIFAIEGTEVIPGQVLATLETSTLKAELDEIEQDLLKKESQARLKQREGKMGEFRIASLEALRTKEEANRVRNDLKHATLLAPVKGIVLTKDLGTKSGTVVETGDVWCELASLDAWNLKIKIDEADAGILEKSLQARGTLNCRFVINARAEMQLSATVRAGDVSQMAYTEEGHQVLYVTIQNVPLPPELSADMRPGFNGLAKIEGIRRPWIATAMARFIQWLQLHILW